MKWSEKKNPFKVGDRILIDHDGDGIIRDIVAIVDSVYVKTKNGHWTHWRRCKLLKKKATRRDFWIKKDVLDSLGKDFTVIGMPITEVHPHPAYEYNWFHVREVIAKKK